MTSIAIINLFPLEAGSTALSLDYRDVLSDIGYNVNFYQCNSSIRKVNFPTNSIIISGVRLPFYWFSLALDLLFIYPYKLKRLNEDYIFLTDPLLLKICVSNPNRIILVHDLRELSPFSSSIFAKLLFRHLLGYITNAMKIITVSETTKQVLHNLVKTNNEAIVIPTCSRIGTERIGEYIPSTEKQDGKLTVLYVAVDRPYKNIQLFLKIAHRMETLDKTKRFNFLLVSKLKKKNKKFLEKLNLKNLRVLEKVENMEEVYSNSQILVFPSRIEGFGLPLLEAMNFSLPIIYSSIEPLLTIMKGCGISADPSSIDQWIEALLLLSERNTYDFYSKLSSERGTHFTKEKFAEKVQFLFHNIRF